MIEDYFLLRCLYTSRDISSLGIHSLRNSRHVRDISVFLFPFSLFPFHCDFLYEGECSSKKNRYLAVYIELWRNVNLLTVCRTSQRGSWKLMERNTLLWLLLQVDGRYILVPYTSIGWSADLSLAEKSSNY